MVSLTTTGNWKVKYNEFLKKTHTGGRTKIKQKATVPTPPCSKLTWPHDLLKEMLPQLHLLIHGFICEGTHLIHWDYFLR